MEEKILEIRLDNLEKKVNELEKVYEAINKLTTNLEKVIIELKYLREDHNRLTDRVTNLESKAGKKWDTAITTVITTVVGAVVGAIMALVIKK